MKKTPLVPQVKLIDAVQTIATKMGSSKLTALTKEQVLETLDEPLKLLMKELDLTMDEAWVFSIVLKNHVDTLNDMDVTDMSGLIGCDNLFALSLTPVLFSLVDKGLLMSNFQTMWGVYTYDQSLFKVMYWPTEKMVNRLILGNDIPEIRPLDEVELLECVHEMGQQMSKWRIMHKQFYAQFHLLLSSNHHWPFIDHLTRLDLAQEEKATILLLMRAHLSGKGVSLDELPSMVFGSIRDRVKYVTSLRALTARIVKENYVKIKNEGMFEETMAYLDTKGKELLSLIDPNFNTVIDVAFVPSEELKTIKPEDIRSVDLVFQSPINDEYERLVKMCSIDTFQSIRQRMKNKGMKGGLTVLLSGAPGTGKTEMVKQLARTNGLPLLQVEMSAIKGMYIGESERNIHKVFLQYARIAQDARATPVLLLNEADAIIGKRMSNLGSVNQAVSQMLNAMQNILLQELEDFEGILIATTNMPNMFDPAFARRFLHKLDVPTPNQDVRQRLWAIRFPAFATHELRQLAQYQLSGAEIDNIAVRMAHLEILEGTEPTLLHLLRFAELECPAPQERVMGFKMSA